jgi:hypothetical protein
VSRRPPRILWLVLAAAVAAALLLAACSTKQELQKVTGEAGNPVPAADFIGNWTPKEVAIDGEWNGTTGTFDVNVGSQGCGFIVTQGAQGLEVTLVASSGVATTPLPATLEIGTITFVVPGPSGGGQTWHLSIPDSAATGAAQMELGNSTVWDLETASQIPTG